MSQPLSIGIFFWLAKDEELWFQQDGATCHTARATIDLLKDTFGDRLISRFGPVNWPPRSCDLTPLDYFLWGYVKSLVYADKPQTLDPLEDNIRRVIANIRPQMLEKVIENWTSRLDYIRASRDCHMPEIIFKICAACLYFSWLPSWHVPLHSITTLGITEPDYPILTSQLIMECMEATLPMDGMVCIVELMVLGDGRNKIHVPNKKLDTLTFGNWNHYHRKKYFCFSIFNHLV
ncbi:DUF4817 domain-containing protein [Trichonephila clavipes]|nr:DUF4817 domain-containing protein [Trichonephila clavipes]